MTQGQGTGVFPAGGGNPPLFAYKNADEARSLDLMVFADDAELFVPLAANKAYFVESIILVSSDPTPDFKMTWTHPTAAVALIGYEQLRQGVIIVEHARFEAMGSSIFVPCLGTNFLRIAHRGVIETTAAGNLVFQWAQNTSDAAVTTVRQGSLLRVQEVAE